MADRKAEKPMKPLEFTHIQHVGGGEERESGNARYNAAQHQQESVADLNNPEKSLNTRPDGETYSAEPLRSGRRHGFLKLPGEDDPKL